METVEDLTVTEEVSVRPPDSRSTPLKSLLKKPSFEMAEPSSSSDCSEAEEGKVSPPSPGPKKVHFSEIDQVRGLGPLSLFRQLLIPGKADVPGVSGQYGGLRGLGDDHLHLPPALHTVSSSGQGRHQQHAGHQTGGAGESSGQRQGLLPPLLVN